MICYFWADEEENDEESGEEQEEGEEGDDEEDEDDGNVAKRVEYYLEKYGELYKCKICSRVVGGKKWHAKRHIRAHWNIRPFACTKCDAKFLRNDHLKRHVEKLRCQGLKDAASAGNPVVVVQEIRKPGIKTPTVSKRKSAAKKPDPEPKKVKKVTQRGQSKKQEKVKKVKAKKPRKK